MFITIIVVVHCISSLISWQYGHINQGHIILYLWETSVTHRSGEHWIFKDNLWKCSWISSCRVHVAFQLGLVFHGYLNLLFVFFHPQCLLSMIPVWAAHRNVETNAVIGADKRAETMQKNAKPPTLAFHLWHRGGTFGLVFRSIEWKYTKCPLWIQCCKLCTSIYYSFNCFKWRRKRGYVLTHILPEHFVSYF